MNQHYQNITNFCPIDYDDYNYTYNIYSLLFLSLILVCMKLIINLCKKTVNNKKVSKKRKFNEKYTNNYNKRRKIDTSFNKLKKCYFCD